jgi:RNA polymerase sigma factor (sigma-70 family)
MKYTELQTATANEIARISARSTLKTFMDKDGSKIFFQLKNSLEADLRYMDNLPALVQSITDNENKRSENAYEIEQNEQAIKDARKTLKSTDNYSACLDISDYIDKLQADTEHRKNENKRLKTAIDTAYQKLDYNYSFAMDIYQVAYRSILEKIALCPLADLEYLPTADGVAKAIDRLKEVIVASVPYKTKDGYKDYTLKTWADKAIREYINDKRSENASRIQYIITGEQDEEGNDILLVADSLQTAGGVTDIFEQKAFNTLLQDMELSASQKTVLKMLLQGKTQKDIADRLNISQQAVADRIKALRKKASTTESGADYIKRHNIVIKK